MTQHQKSYKIILVGDNCLDIYQYVNVNRISPEAPVPVAVTQESFEKPGMAANVGKNLQHLNCEVDFFTGSCHEKTRIIDTHSGQHLLRIDNDIEDNHISYTDLEKIKETEADAIIISDYDKGFLTYDSIRDIIKNSGDTPVFIDTKKKHLGEFYGAYIKINENEFRNASTYNDELIVTRSSKSVLYKGKEFEVSTKGVVDVCGAGDTFMAALVYEFLEKGSIEDAIPFAIKASSITVKHVGVYAPRLEEI